jgi:RHS repeat-associated protein
MGPSVGDGLLYDEQNRVVAELDASSNVLSTFVYGLKPNVPDYMVRGGTAYRIISDWRGDVRLVLNTTATGTAAVVQQLDYDAWGNVTNLVDPDCSVGGTAICFQPFGFAGGLWEPATGMVRFGARDYDPMAARWTQKDPIGFGGGQANLYRYVGDDPINGTDATGLWMSPSCLQGVTAGCNAQCEGTCGGLAAGACASTCIQAAKWIEQLVPGSICDNEPVQSPNIHCSYVALGATNDCFAAGGSFQKCTVAGLIAYAQCLASPPN